MDYSVFQEAALKQVTDKGRAVTISHKIQGTYDAATDAFTGQATITQAARAVFTSFKLRDVDGSKIKSGDKIALFAASELSPAPDVGDTVTDGSTVYVVMGIDTIAPGDVVILYKIHLRA